MKAFDSYHIRNLAVVAHGGAGKTSLTEALLFCAGATKRLGKVDEGNTVTDYFPEEIKRKVTIHTVPASFEWNNHKLNVLDTPGYSDFVGDVIAALRVVEGLVFVVSAVAGVEVQTEVIWEMADERRLPIVAFINKMDRENANFFNVLANMRERLSRDIVPVHIPIGEAGDFRGTIDLLTGKALIYEPGSGSKPVETSIPNDYAEQVSQYQEQLAEAAAESDDDLLEKYLEGERLSPDELALGLHKGVAQGKVVPVFCGSALNNMGIGALLQSIIDLLPPPISSPEEAKSIAEKPLGALTFKTLSDPYVGRLTFFKVIEGVMRSDSLVLNSNKQTEEKVGQILVMQGKNQFPVDLLGPGDIGAVAKLQATSTGETLTSKGNQRVFEGIDFPEPNLAIAIKPKTKGDEDKLSNALAKLLEEDNTLKVEKNLETKETLLLGMGEMHLDITLERLQRKFGVEVSQSSPKVPYRETIRIPVKRVEGKHKKQTGGHGQYGHVFIDVEPLADQEFAFEETIFGGAVPKQYIPAVEKGIREALNEGILAGYPVTNIKVTLVDGSYHPVDSSEMAFKIAAALALRKALEQAKPVLLEPIANVEIRVPEQFMGDIIGDLNSKRGRILGMEPDGKMQLIRAQVPMAEMYRYAIDLKAITQGRGQFHMEFGQYEEAPSNVAEKVIEEARKAKQG